MVDIRGQLLLVGDTILWSAAEGSDLVEGVISKITEKMVIVNRPVGFWPRVVKRYPQQVIRVDTP